ncbi:hypothetical protein [Chromobacterium sp. CV08]|uniref:hypothetical protein n=1 Tax=Chromobacterium sp. CV08 TaxID=3133274 RepID=UPI003DA7C3DC
MGKCSIQQLSERVDFALQDLKSGQPRLIDAKMIVHEFRNVTISQMSDLFPGDPHFEQNLRSRLHVLQELEYALDRLHNIGVSQSTRLRDIPFFDTVLRVALNEAAAGRPGGISFR